MDFDNDQPKSEISVSQSRSDLPERRNILLVIAYDGANYHGWQKQTDDIDTVQQRLEQAAARVMGHRIISFGAGRTDAGVHAAGQTANFYTINPHIPVRNIRRAVNSALPADINILSARLVDDSFHASRSAVGKTYRYRIFTSPNIDPATARVAYHYPWKHLDVDKMRQAAAKLLGRHDFRGLASSAELRKNTVRTITRCDLSTHGSEIHLHVEGSGFLYNMVRNIAGTLMEIGRGGREITRIDKILASCDRCDAGFTACAHGLSLMSVHYPDRYMK